MQSYNRDDLVKQLENNILNVKFTKKDGTIRDLKCTLISSMLPPAEKELVDIAGTTQMKITEENIYVEGSDTFKKANTNVISVWDLEKNEWRSFRVDSILEVKS